MSEPHDCHPACAGTCAGGPRELEPIDLAEAAARFGREARHGTCDTGRYRMPYFTWGEGPPLVFVHGLSDTARSFLLPMARLSAGFRCVGYELPAGGADGARLRRYAFDDLVADLWALLDHLGLGRAYVLGSSLGAAVALKALHARPERLPRGVLQGALAHRPLRRAEKVLAWVARWLPGTMGGLPKRERILWKLNRGFFAHRPPEVWRYFVECTGRPPVAAVGHQARWLHGLDLRPILAGVRQPVLLVCGEHDRVVPAAYQDELLRGLPNAGRAVIAGCGHTPSYTHPEVFAEVVRQFLTPPPKGNHRVTEGTEGSTTEGKNQG
jgi:pimeloyl-ACP methyl ester carboxylesterase